MEHNWIKHENYSEVNQVHICVNCGLVYNLEPYKDRREIMYYEKYEGSYMEVEESSCDLVQTRKNNRLMKDILK